MVEVQTLTMACRELTKQDVGSAFFWCFHFFVCTRACVTVCVLANFHMSVFVGERCVRKSLRQIQNKQNTKGIHRFLTVDSKYMGPTTKKTKNDVSLAFLE